MDENTIYEAFCIEGGRKQFYQWDTDQKIIVNDRNIDEVHFCNGTTDKSLVSVVKDGKANVPNLILQTAARVRVYGYSVNHTVVEKVYEVKARTKPEDYVYVETEVYRWAELDKRIQQLEEIGIPEDGKSAYEIAKDNGFEGTEEEWLESLHGKDGKDGDTHVFLVREIIDGISDKSKEEAEAAAKAGKAVLLVTKYGEVYTYYAKEKIPGTDEYAIAFLMPITKAATGKRRSVIYLRADNALLRKAETPFTAVAENPLTIKTANAEIEYNGSEKKEIDLTNLGSGGSGRWYTFSVHERGDEITTYVTVSQIRNALNSGQEPVCIYRWDTDDDPSYIITFQKVLRLETYNIGNTVSFQDFQKPSTRLADYNYIKITLRDEDDGSTSVNIEKERYALHNEIPTVLPNPKNLVINQGTNKWSYSGEETVNVNLPEIPTSIPWSAITNKPVIPEPVTSLPWSAITDKPFDHDVTLDMEIVEGFDGNIYTPFTLKANTNYRITLKAGNTVITEQATSIEHNFDGLKCVTLGNLGLMGDQSMNTGEGFLVVNIPGAEMMNPPVVYGMAVFNPYAYPDVNFGDGAITGRVVIENIDEFKPVPEDLIPTMSETTKGGAKVGKGLKMDGDALTVDEGEWELIETIEITEPMVIERTQEPSGNPYNFEALAIVARRKPEITTKEVTAFAVCGDLNITTYIQSHSSTSTHQMVMVDKKYGYWEVRRTSWGSNTSLNTASIATGQYFNRLADKNINRWYSATQFDAGMTIEIWGVRA